MRDLWNLFRGNLPRLDSMSYAFEKGGLSLENQPIPWGADSILVNAVAELPHQLPRTKGDFELRVGNETALPESQRVEDSADTARLQFRVNVPAVPAAAELLWRGRSLGQIALPILSPEEFARKVTLQMPTACVRIGEQAVACQTYVTTQCQGLILSGLIQSATSLVPVLDLGMRVEISRQEGGAISKVPIQLSSSQLRARQALISVVLPKPKRMGTWQITWFLGDRPLASHGVKGISPKQFLRSLRVSSTRFVLQSCAASSRSNASSPTSRELPVSGPASLWPAAKAAWPGGARFRSAPK